MVKSGGEQLGDEELEGAVVRGGQGLDGGEAEGRGHMTGGGTGGDKVSS